jgi:branched-chain amino acid transport system substrate-binding protein
MKTAKMRGIGIAAAMAVCVAMGAPVPTAADTLKIGVIIPLTGNSAANGQSMRDGILLAVDQINKRGGVNGAKIEAVIADSRSDPQGGVEAFNTVEASLPPLFYISALSSVGVALAPLVDAKKVVLVGISTSARAFTQGHDMVYRDFPLTQTEISPLLRILKDLKVRKLGIIYSSEEYGTEINGDLKKNFEDIGGTVASQSILLTDKDVSRQIEQLKGQQAIVVATLGASLTNAVRQLKAAQYGGSVLVPSAGAVPEYFALPEMNAVYLSAPIIYNPGYLYAREASSKFVTLYDKPFTVYAANGYSCIQLMSGLIEGRLLSRQSVKDAMASGFEYSGVLGSVKLKAGDHDISFIMYPAQVLNGALTYR